MPRGAGPGTGRAEQGQAGSVPANCTEAPTANRGPPACRGDARAGRRRGLAGRNTHDGLRERLQAQAGEDGRISLRFEIVYGHAWRTRPRVRPPEAPIVFTRKGNR